MYWTEHGPPGHVKFPGATIRSPLLVIFSLM